MALKRDDFAAFEVSWGDKASALRRIASDLSLGIDSLVFIDDNPAERALILRELPAVSVPELPDAPELFARCVADGGYFDAVAFTAEDAARREQYAANRERRRLETTVTDIDGFLRELDMTSRTLSADDPFGVRHTLTAPGRGIPPTHAPIN